ncbi:hypothetical protein [Lederbergia lenta]|uniref:hypothetical protein n=1 Tax=Lederbergia lenta TaxID=1467 RepID=UPI00398BADCF
MKFAIVIPIGDVGEDNILISTFIIFAIFILYIFNNLTNTLCIVREIPEERQPKVFRTINVLLTILLFSSYIEILYT